MNIKGISFVKLKKKIIIWNTQCRMYTKNSVVEPEPDSFAGAGDGAGEKETAPACCYVIKGF